MISLIKWGIALPILTTGFMALLHEIHFKGGVCTSTKRLDGKTVIITGTCMCVSVHARACVCVCACVCVFVYLCAFV